MARYTPTPARLLALGFGQVSETLFTFTTPEGTILHLELLPGGSLTVAVGVAVGQPVPAALPVRPPTEAKFNNLLTMLGVPL